MNPNQRNRPTKAPMRGQGRRPPMQQQPPPQQSGYNMPSQRGNPMRGRGGRGPMMSSRGRGRGRPVPSGYQQQPPQQSYQQPTYASNNYQQQNVMPQSYGQQQVVPQIPQHQPVVPQQQRVPPQQVQQQQQQRMPQQQMMSNTQSMNIPQIQNMPAMNTMNMGQQQQVNTMQQQNIGQSVNDTMQQKPRSRPPMRTQNNDQFALFNQANQQQQQQVNTMQQQQQRQPTRQPIANVNGGSNVAQNPSPMQQQPPQQQPKVPPQSKQTPKKVDTSKSSSKTTSVSPPNKRLPPWVEFTGEKKGPVDCGWAHRVRQILSADTLRIALLKKKGKGAALDPPEIIQVTLDGIEAPRTQRFGAPPPSPSKGKKKKSKKEQDEEQEQKNNFAQDDEPFAYDAREFVRSKVSNKNIFYAVWKENSRNEDANNQSRNNRRYWGDIYYLESKGVTKSLTQELIANGYASLKDGNYNNLSVKEEETLKKKQKAASEKKLNIWSDNKAKKEKSIRDIEWIPYEKQKEFGEQYKGKVLNGIVDQVISGGTLRVELVISKNQNRHVNVVVNIAGINAPKTPPKKGSANSRRQANNKQMDKAQEDALKVQLQLERSFGEKAKEYCSDRLLGQAVGVRILFVSNSQIIAQIIHRAGRIAPALLRCGLAQYEAWTAKGLENFDKEEKELMFKASEMAKKTGINIWAHLDANKTKSSAKEMFVTVVEVISGDTVLVEYPKKNAKGPNDVIQERYTMSSIRTPRLGTRGGYPSQEDMEKKKVPYVYSVDYATPDELYAREAKEVVRQMCMGKTVRILVEYQRGIKIPGGGKNQKKREINKKFCTIYAKNAKGKEQNVALELMKMGYAELVYHRKGDDRSEAYSRLEDAYEKARQKKVGLNEYIKYNKDNNRFEANTPKRKQKAKEMAIKDYSGADERKIKPHELIALNQFLTAGKVKGVIEFVFGGNRVKVYIPSKRVCIAVRLADIKVGGWDTDNEDEYKKKAKAYLRKTILQRDITLEIVSTGQQQQKGRGRGKKGQKGRQQSGTMESRNPNLDGHIYLNNKNISEWLLQSGLATVITPGYNQQRNRKRGVPKNFHDLEQEAREKGLGIHSGYEMNDGDEKNEDEQRNRMLITSKTSKELEVVVSHIESATIFYVNMADDAGMNAMQNMGLEMEKLKKSDKIPKRINAKGKGVRYAAKYDGHYARVRVNNRDKRGQEDNAQSDKKESESNWFVMFIDYGNKASISRKQFVELPDTLRLDRIKPLAHRCELAGIQTYRRNQAEYNNAGYWFGNQCFQNENQKLRMKVLYDDQSEYYKTWYVELFVGDKSINQMIAREGYVTLVKEKKLPPAMIYQSEYGKEWSKEHKTYVKQYFDAIKANIALAKDEHKHIWHFGDVDSEEDDNLFGNQRGKGGKK